MPDRDNKFTLLCRDFAENTTFHGCANVVRSKGVFWRLLWTLIILGAVAMLTKQIFELWMRYESNPIATSIEVSTSPLPFPSVTLCNLNSIRKSVLESKENEGVESLQKLNEIVATLNAKKEAAKQQQAEQKTGLRRMKRSEDASSYSDNVTYTGADNTTTDDDDDYYYYYDGGDADVYDNYGSYGAEQEPEYDDEYLARRRIANYVSRLPYATAESIGQVKETFIHKCSFMGRDCHLSQFSKYYSVQYGNCFTFNSNEVRNKSIIAGRSGHGAGLVLTLNLEHHEYIPVYTTGYGLVLVIHDFGTYPFPSQQGMSVPAGFETHIGLAMRNVSRLDKPYGDCVKGKWFYEKYGKKYTYEACVTVCIHREIYDRCECYQYGAFQYYRDVPVTKPCDTKEEVQCLKQVHKEMKEELLCDCRQPCSEMVFDTSASMNQWPELEYQAYLVKEACQMKGKTDVCKLWTNMTASEARKTLASVSIFYRGLNYEVISQEPAYLLPNFLSDLGGTLGLWAGFSILTGTEVLVLVFHFIKQCLMVICGCGKNKKQPQEDENFTELQEKADNSHAV